MKKILTLALLSAVAGSGAIATSANAATLIVNSSGILTGATGVTVGTKKYNVAFKDGTCAQVYGKCETSSFDFTTIEDGFAASVALLDQVFIDGPSGRFDSNPGLTLGCESAVFCNSYIALSASAFELSLAYPQNRRTVDTTISGLNRPSSLDTTQNELLNFARFTLVPDSVTSAVPEPATWAMMIGGFVMVGATMRRRKVNTSVRFV